MAIQIKCLKDGFCNMAKSTPDIIETKPKDKVFKKVSKGSGNASQPRSTPLLSQLKLYHALFCIPFTF